MNIADKESLAALFDAAVAAADPGLAIAPVLPEPPKGRTVVIGAGKGAAQMAQAFEAHWPHGCEGLVVTRYGYAAPCKTLEVLEAAHPVPDEASLRATAAIKQAVSGLSEDDLVISLVCGGGSALLAAPPEGLALEDEADLNKALLASGAPIGAMNAIRKQVSTIKGGRLAALAHPARLISLVVSDVPGDDPAQVASGQTVADATDRAAALKAVADYRIDLPERVAQFLAQAPEDAPLPDDPKVSSNVTHVVASAGLSLEAAAAKSDVPSVILSDAIEGEARDVGRVHGAIVREVLMRDRPFSKPCLMLSGGETTVTLRGSGGRGGRNTEFLLSLAIALDGVPGWQALAADTDGIDGSEDNAGAFADGTTCARLRAAGHDPMALLSDND
ncbi:MAG: glycerate kinase, partial [Pseudomonadota bacterium]